MFAVAVITLPIAVAAPAEASASPKPSVEASLDASASDLPWVGAQSWILADADTGKILAQQDADRQLPPASTLKMLTAAALMPRLVGESTYVATYQDINQRGTKVGFRAGETYPVTDLFKGMLIKSGNDAASAVANAYGGWDQAVNQMNVEAARLGATNTHATNPSGLDDSDQHTTAKDLALIFREAIKDKETRDILSLKTDDIPSQGRMLHLVSYDRLLHEDYDGIIGAKLGYTPAAGRTLVAAAERDGHTLVLAAMRTAERMDHIAGKVFDWAFENYDQINAVGQLPAPGPEQPIVAHPAIQMDQFGTPLPGQEQVLDQLVHDAASTSALPADEGAGAGGISIVKLAIWIVLIGLGLVVALRTIAVIRLRRRTAKRHDHTFESEPNEQINLTDADQTAGKKPTLS